MGGDESPAQGHIVVWISKQGYMNKTIIRIEDDDGNHLNVQFYPFLDPAIVSDQALPFRVLGVLYGYAERVLFTTFSNTL